MLPLVGLEKARAMHANLITNNRPVGVSVRAGRHRRTFLCAQNGKVTRWESAKGPIFGRKIRVPLTNSSASWDPSVESIDEETVELLEKYSATFKAADTNGDGVLQRDELRALLEKVASGEEAVPLHWMTDADLDQIFEIYDKDKDGTISFDEFKHLAHDNVFLTKELREYQAAFRACDAGGDGFIGPNEMCAVLTALGSPLKSYDNIIKLMDKYDLDNSGRIDFGEFLRLCRYEKALPLDDILKYAAIRTSRSAARAARRASSSSSSDSGGEDLASSVISIHDEKTLQDVMDIAKDKLVVLMGTVTWCRPCKRFSPIFKRLAAAYPSVVFIVLNGNDSEETKTLFKKTLKIRATPSFLFFRKGQLVGNSTGANASRFESTLRTYLGEDELPEKNVYDLIDVTEVHQEA